MAAVHYKKQSLLLWLCGIILMIAVAVLSLISIYSNRQALIVEAKNSTKALASFAMADAERLVFGITMMFPGINDVLETQAVVLNDFDSKITDILLSRKLSNPYLMDLLVLNEQGLITQWTGEGKVPDVLDREYVKTHLDGGAEKKYLWVNLNYLKYMKIDGFLL